MYRRQATARVDVHILGVCIELVLFHWCVWQQTTPLFCDSQVRNLYELKINEIYKAQPKRFFTG